jgi:hypothetical protein
VKLPPIQTSIFLSKPQLILRHFRHTLDTHSLHQRRRVCIVHTKSYTKLHPLNSSSRETNATETHTPAMMKSENKRQFMTYVQFHTIPSLDQGKRKRKIHKVKERTQTKIIKESEWTLLPMPSAGPSATGLPAIIWRRCAGLYPQTWKQELCQVFMSDPGCINARERNAALPWVGFRGHRCAMRRRNYTFHRRYVCSSCSSGHAWYTTTL